MDRVRNELSGTTNGLVIQAGSVVFGGKSTPAAVAGLPAQPVFVGRSVELDQLIAAVRPAADSAPVVVCALGGLPGVGKTALAVRAARVAEQSGWFPGGVVMIDLHGYDGPETRMTASAALASLLSALGIAAENIPDGLDDRARLWRTLLSQREQPTLVIADNASSTAQVRPLLPGTATHRVLVTSRDRLADLDGARTLRINALGTADAVRMLTEIVASGDPGDQRVRREPDAAEQVAALCGGLPLAIRVVAALLVADPDRSLAELAENLADDRTRLGILHYDGSLAVRTAFDLSYRGLDEERARLFRLIGLHPGADPSTEVIAALADRDVAGTRDLLRGLARAHLVHPAAIRGCWGMHDLLRDYATEHGARDVERTSALKRMIAHYGTACEQLNTARSPNRAEASSPYFTNLREALVWADRERRTLVAVAGIAADIGDHFALIHMVLNLNEYLTIRQASTEFATVNALALDAARALGDRKREAKIFDQMGHFYRRQGQSHEAMEYLEQSLRLARLVGARAEEARALDHLGEVLYDLGRFEESATVVRQALAMFRELDLPGQVGNALHNLGVAYRFLGRPDQSLGLHLEDLRICREVTGDQIAIARVLDNLGITYRALGDFPTAVDHHERAIDMARDVGSDPDVGRATRNLGCTYREWQRLPDAIACLERSVRLLDETRHLADLATSLLELGTTHRAADDPVQATRRWEEALEILGRLPGVRPAAQAAWIREALSTLPPPAPHIY